MINLIQYGMAVLTLLLAPVQVGTGPGTTPPPRCPVLNVEVDWTQGCGDSSTGCVCSLSGSVWTVVSEQNCGGCTFRYNGVATCTNNSNPFATQYDMWCDASTGCSSLGSCVMDCPCTDTPWLEVSYICGACPGDH